MRKSCHAKKRQQQRGIKEQTIEILEEYGERFFKKDGTVVLLIPKRLHERMQKKFPKLKNIISTYVLETENEDKAITIGHHFKKNLLH